MPHTSGGAAAGASAPLIALGVVVLDTETTGLDVRQDRIIQIGAVSMHGADILESQVFDVIVDPGIPIPAGSSRVHGLLDADVAGRPRFAEVASGLLDFIGQSVVVGHSINFDLAVLRNEAHRHGVAWKEPRWLDVALMSVAITPGLVSPSLDNLALTYGVTIEGRHTALGDARATAGVYAAMQPRLLEKGVRTLGEAENLGRAASALVAQQQGVGWFERPTGKAEFAPAAIQTGSRRAIDSFLYRQRLEDVMSSPPICVDADCSLREASRLMTQKGIGCAIVTRDDGTHGILSERDILRALAEKGAEASDVAAGTVMSVPVIAAPGDTFLYRALGLMARKNLRYLGVTGASGELVGIFTLRTLLRERALATLTLGDEIAAASRPRELARVQAELPSLAAGLLSDGLDARAVAAVISAERRAMATRAAEIAEGELIAAGQGAAPADYALLVLGSAGRGESLLAPDQDNALVIADGYRGDLGSAEDWFTRFATRVNEILDRAGIPYCDSGVMARNRVWRLRLSEWLNEVRGWAEHPTPKVLANVDIFFDFTPVHVSSKAGARLAETLRTEATAIVRTAPGLLTAMSDGASGRNAALGLFGRIRKDGSGRTDLKAAMLPIVAGARTAALRRGIGSLPTAQRIREVAAAAGYPQADAALLVDIHGFLMRLILTQQIADIEAGVKPSNRVDLNILRRQDRERLHDALHRTGMIRELLQT
ncbi:MAG: CBS domain-containing protein [Alphaproteobacteria bacterium]|nr:CBS domain-containing protein [Alphaproteobacteria bacterium]MBU1549138.1 CBS domain-containing protein [Alphaproteobacteria bacterium]MBU2337471.1 CBS domain-containing protein [Alphaproteobacteria bacterium]MBU2389007.1 CBS domain-containing protein [Alphaproteobacteria bacterium]